MYVIHVQFSWAPLMRSPLGLGYLSAKEGWPLVRVAIYKGSTLYHWPNRLFRELSAQLLFFITHCIYHGGNVSTLFSITFILYDTYVTCISIFRLMSRHKDVVEDSSLPDEMLYGRAGYICSLLLVQKHLGKSAIDPAIIDRVSLFFLSHGSCYYPGSLFFFRCLNSYLSLPQQL